jgi:hypothetical protein
MSRRSWGVAILVVVALVVCLIFVERMLNDTDTSGIGLQGKLSDVAKQVISLNLELYKLFATLSTAVIGGVAFYLHRKEGTRHRGSRIIAVVVLMSVVISLFFGHLWIAMMRNQLAHDAFSPVQDAVRWCEALQYGFFLLSLMLFAMLVLVEDIAVKEAKV